MPVFPHLAAFRDHTAHREFLSQSSMQWFEMTRPPLKEPAAPLRLVPMHWTPEEAAISMHDETANPRSESSIM